MRVGPDRKVTVQLPADVRTGLLPLVVVVGDPVSELAEPAPPDPYTPEERRQVERLAAGIDWAATAARCPPPPAWLAADDNPFVPEPQPETAR